MSIEVASPFTVFFDRSGQPLDAGYVYIGTAGINPEVSPISVYWDTALTTPAAQPIRTLAGYPSQNGSPGTIIINQATYSIVVRDKNGALVYSNLNAFIDFANVLYSQTYAALSALTTASGLVNNAVYIVAGAAAAGDGGAGMFRYVAGSTTTVDNGMVLTAVNGRLFRLATGEIEAQWYGAKGDGVTDDTAALNAWLAYLVANGAEGLLNNGNYLTTSKLIIDESSVTTEELTRVSIRGEGDGNTAIQSNHAGRCIEYQGGTGGGLGSYIKFSGFRLNGSGQVGGVGLWLDNCAWAHFEDMTISAFERGIDGTDVLSTVFDSCRIRFNFMGFRFAYSDASRPNAITFRDCIIGANYTYGGLITGGASINIRGGSLEGNGQTEGVPTVGGYGVKLVDCGVEGATGLVASGVYCEGNADTADFWIVQTTGDVMHSISGCSFARISSSYFVTNNIRFDRSGGNSRAWVGGCGFTTFNTYVENSGRRYLDGPATGVVDAGNYYQSTTAAPAASDTRGPFCGAFDDTGASISLPKDWTCVNSGTGLVTVTHNLGTTNYAVVATTIEAASERVERITKNTNSFIIVTTTSGEVLANAAANFIAQLY